MASSAHRQTPRKSKRLFVSPGNSQGGTYVLRMRVTQAVSIAFGRFHGGKVISVIPGDYSYVGSALSERGATCLARRLVRHATRTGRKRPHSIRQTMLTEFDHVGLGEGDLRPREGKSLRWNVDHLLDRSDVELVAAYLIRSPRRVEGDLGRLLERDAATVVFKKGLGAGDVPGNTHILRVDADEEWWLGLSQRLVDFLAHSATLCDPPATL